MITEDQILLYLHNDSWFTPSNEVGSKAEKTIKAENGDNIVVKRSYYHKYGNSFIERITIRVSDHGTSLRTWVKHTPPPNETLQNLSVVFAATPVTSRVDTEMVWVKDPTTNQLVKKHRYFVVEQYVYMLQSLSIEDFKKVINKLKGLSNTNVFLDPLKKKPNKRANRTVLLPTDAEGNKIASSANTVNPRQTVVAANTEKEVDALGNIVKDSRYINSIDSIITEVLYRYLGRELLRT